MIKTLACLALLCVTAPLSAQTGVDTTGTAAIVRQATDHSEVMKNLQYLGDIIGPRLTGSPAMRRANDWAAERFKSYGLNTAIEPWAFGVTWERGPVFARLLAPFQRGMTAHSWAWTAGTDGKPEAGPVVLVNVSSPESLAVYKDHMKGAWLLTGGPATIFNPDGPPMTAADSAAMRARFNRARFPQDTSAVAVARRRQFQTDLPYLLKQAGALGRLTDGGKEQGLMNMSGSPYSVSPLPNLVIAHEDFAQLARLIQSGVTPRFEAAVTNTMGSQPVQQYNTVAEIRGTEKPGEVVILGAHLDSWDLGTGTTDNGTGSMVVLEAARAIAQSGLKPKRTIRFILFS
ncbi:MAG TPA: M28 family peptidase, partial [Gemmatimonadaceae bacterium]